MTERNRSPSPTCKITVTSDDATNLLLRDLSRKRSIVKGRLTRFSNYLNAINTDENLPEKTRVELKIRVKGAESLFREFNDFQSQLEENVLSVDLDEQIKQRDVFEDTYYETLARAECMLSSVDHTASSKAQSDFKHVKLPTITIPTFDGSYERWLEFRDTFQSLIHNTNHITAIQKFHYLKSSLKGSAASVIESIEFSAANYEVAWELLLARYDNSRLLVHNHVKSLFNIPSLTKEAPDSLRSLIDTVLKNLRALKMLGEPVNYWDTLIIYIIVTKLDKITEREWEQHKSLFLKKSDDSKSIMKVEVLLDFLRDRADMLETLLVSHASTSSKKSSTNTHSSNKVHCNVSTNNPSSQSKKSPCSLCTKSNHPLYVCRIFLGLDIHSRLKHIKENHLCENCLRAGHALNDCRFGPCRKCSKKHNSLICDSEVSAGQSPPAAADSVKLVSMHTSLPVRQDTPAEPSIKTTDAHTDVLCANYQCEQPVLLSTAVVEVKDRYNNYHTARALLDSGSERCIITQSLCDKLGVQLIQSTQEIRGVGNSVSQSTKICEVDVRSCTSSYIMRLKCFVLKNISSLLPAVPEQYAKFGIPGNIQLADPDFHESRTIDILIGADIFWDLLCEGKMRLPNGPFLQNTQLGWVVSGPLNIMRKKSYMRCNFTQSADEQLRKFWELEEIPTLCDARSQEEKTCEEHFVKTTMRNNDGRFCVSIPFESSPQRLGESYPQALNRFLALEKRLQRDPEYKRLYCDFIHEYVALGHMTRINSYSTLNFFLPHHGVFLEHSTTTKLRVVFNASAASSSEVSLNELQLAGPAIQGDLLGILLRLRLRKSDNKTELLDLCEKTYNVLQSGCFPLRKRIFNFSCDDLTSENSPITMRDDLPEVKSNSVSVLHTIQGEEIFPFSRFSQFERMRRSFAYVLRFVYNMRNKLNRKSGSLTVDELRESELGLAKISQVESFGEEYVLISRNQSLKKTPSLFKLNAFLDKNKIMRAGGRLANSDEYDFDKKHPVVLSAKHRFSVLLMRHEHLRLLHAAPQALLYDVRQRWWPVGGRNLARKIVNECVVCKRLKGKTLNPIMSSLPRNRLTPTYPFHQCGVDMAGPFLTLNRKGRGARTQKSYICLIVCFVTRAVHLELVSDLSTEAYILALKRFISRRGKPHTIHSDNGKNFVGTCNELKRFLQVCSSDITEFAVSQSVNFKFIPPYSPHFGGLWESGVKSCKLHLSRIVGNARLTFEEFTTVLTQVEAILNSRPLSPLSSDPNDFLPLTPGHFLVGRPLTSPVYQDMRGDPGTLLNRYQRVELIRHNFWARWAKEYISEMQARCKWRENVDSLEPNTLVVIKDDNLPPLKWSLGRIVSTIKGNDGISRVADIRTASGIVRRSYPKICPLFKEDDLSTK